MRYRIVQALPSHVPFLADIEDAAGELSSHDDLPEPGRSAGVSLEQFHAAVTAQRVRVAVEQAQAVPVGFVMVEIVEGCWHVLELDVRPDQARRGIGSHLLDHALAVGAERGFRRATLTTFEHVPWNAPYYARRGFHALRADELSLGLARIRAREDALGMRRRVAMARALHGIPPASPSG